MSKIELPDPVFHLKLAHHLSFATHGEWTYVDNDKGITVFKTSEQGRPPHVYTIHETRESFTDFKSLVAAYKATDGYRSAIAKVL